MSLLLILISFKHFSGVSIVEIRQKNIRRVFFSQHGYHGYCEINKLIIFVMQFNCVAYAGVETVFISWVRYLVT